MYIGRFSEDPTSRVETLRTVWLVMMMMMMMMVMMTTIDRITTINHFKVPQGKSEANGRIVKVLHSCNLQLLSNSSVIT